MNKIELSLHLEASYQISGRGCPRKPLFGVGVNDADYTTQPMVNGVRLRDPAHTAWADMLKRAYDQKFHAVNPTYIGVTVCKEWHSFSAFRAWWLDHYRDGFSLDKDLLVISNREYGPSACIYVPRWLNSFTIDSESSRGEFPIGVCLHKQNGKYQSNCGNPITGKQHYLGLFNAPAAAHEAWLDYKLSLADQLKHAMDAIDKRIYPNVVTIIKALI